MTAQQFVATGSVRVLESVRRELDEPLVDHLVERLRRAIEDFPEIHGAPVTLAVLHPRDEEGYKGRADGHNGLVYVRSSKRTTNVTLYHELGHLAIRELDRHGEDVPTTSEEFCSIFAMARMPPDRIDEFRIPYLEPNPVRLGTKFWPAVCRRALKYRERHRDYIKQCERWLSGREEIAAIPRTAAPEKGSGRA